MPICKKVGYEFLAMRGPSLNLKPRIAERIARSPTRAWAPADFADLAPRRAIDSALSRMVASGELRRIGRGLYDKPWTNQLTGRPSAPDVEATIAAATRRSGLRYVVDGLTAANALGLTDAVPAKTIVHVNARLKPVKLGNLEIVFRRTSGSKLAWAGRPAMRLVQALHWLKDTLPRDEPWLMPKISRLIEDGPDGEAIRDDLEKGFALLPVWMQELLRGFVLRRDAPRPAPDMLDQPPT